MGFDPRTEAMLGLQDRLYMLARSNDYETQWPGKQLDCLRQAGIYRWFAPVSLGGVGWSDIDQVEGYRFISRSCLTTAFVLTQRTAAFSRILASENTKARQRWLPGLIDGSLFATVAISHLTTSRQHVDQPVLLGRQLDENQYVLNGYSPWVTGASCADCLVTGFTLESGKQVLAAIDTLTSGIQPGPGQKLVGLSGSKTDQVQFKNVIVSTEDVLLGPQSNVMRTSKGSGAGGLQTSSLALGLAEAAIQYMIQQANNRPDLRPIADALKEDWAAAWKDLRSLADGTGNCSTEDVRQRANSLALRATQATLTAAKGAGYLADHPASRWCREALFFLVWSCPKSVSQANLCEFAGITND